LVVVKLLIAPGFFKEYTMTLEQQIKKVITLAEKKGLSDAAEFLKGFIKKQEVIVKKERKCKK
jgi:hypothetical protein